MPKLFAILLALFALIQVCRMEDAAEAAEERAADAGDGGQGLPEPILAVLRQIPGINALPIPGLAPSPGDKKPEGPKA